MKHFYIIAPNGEEQVSQVDRFGAVIVKLGFSDSPSARLLQLQSGNHIELVILDSCLLRNAKNFEQFIHRAFKDNRVRGEWYKLSYEEVRMLYDHMDNAAVECDCRACNGYYQAPQAWRKRQDWRPDADGWYHMKKEPANA